MKLHRLVLRNYRGITHRDIEFPDHGVVVISGANEIGKSSMIEALDLLLHSKDRSAKKEVKQVKPTHVDEGAEITAVISCGPYRFEYFKRFHKRPVTELTITEPRREQCTGDEAHERVRAILEETVDIDLWNAQRVLQSGATAPVDLSGCDALSRALDVAAGQAVALSGAEPLLVDRIDAEFRQYFTATGRPTGDWLAAINRLRAAQDLVAEAEAEVAEVDDAVVRHGDLTDVLARVTLDRAHAAKRLDVAREAAETVRQLTERLAGERELADAADQKCAAFVAALEERRRLRADLDARAATIADLERAAQLTGPEVATAEEVKEAAEFGVVEAKTAVDACQARVDAARRTVAVIADQDETQRLAAKLAKIDAAERELVGVDTELAAIKFTDGSMRAIETAAAAVELATARAELASARVELVAAADVDLRVAGEAVRLSAGQSWSTSATGPTDVELPALLTVRLLPGEPAADTQAVLDAARQHLAALLEHVEASDVEAARSLDARRRELLATQVRVRATRAALTGDDSVESMRARLAELRTRPTGELGDAASANAELEAATAEHRRALSTCEVRRDVAAAAVAAATHQSTAATVLREKLSNARAELTAVGERLARQRESTSDDDLALRVAGGAERAREFGARVRAVETELAGAAPAAVAAELDDARRHHDILVGRHEEAGEQLRDVTAALKVYGTEGRRGRLDDAQIQLEDAAAEHSRLRRRAGAVHALRSVMLRHRDDARLRYVEPFRSEVERLGRVVFGADFEVEIDAELRICSRTLAGCTVPYESLSGGAKEQLGIVARLAGAALVAKEDGVPVLIDDALGFTDANRLTRMGEVFDAVGGDGQVIVLTCSPERYSSVRDARHIELTA
jgi:AAA ATPase domain